MKKEDRSLGRRLVINMVGNCLDYEKAFSRRQDIDDLIHYAGVVPHRETFTRMQQAQVLLLLLPDNEKGRSCIPSKLFTYILTGKPVLALVPDGDAADVVRGTKTGIVVNPRDKVAVKAALRKLTVEHGQGILRSLPDWEEISKYDRRILTGALAGVFHEITDDGCPSAFTVQEGKGADTCRDSGSISCMSRTPSK